MKQNEIICCWNQTIMQKNIFWKIDQHWKIIKRDTHE